MSSGDGGLLLLFVTWATRRVLNFVVMIILRRLVMIVIVKWGSVVIWIPSSLSVMINLWFRQKMSKTVKRMGQFKYICESYRKESCIRR